MCQYRRRCKLLCVGRDAARSMRYGVTRTLVFVDDSLRRNNNSSSSRRALRSEARTSSARKRRHAAALEQSTASARGGRSLFVGAAQRLETCSHGKEDFSTQKVKECSGATRGVWCSKECSSRFCGPCLGDSATWGRTTEGGKTADSRGLREGQGRRLGHCSWRGSQAQITSRGNAGTCNLGGPYGETVGSWPV